MAGPNHDHPELQADDNLQNMTMKVKRKEKIGFLLENLGPEVNSSMDKCIAHIFCLFLILNFFLTTQVYTNDNFDLVCKGVYVERFNVFFFKYFWNIS